MTSSISRVLTIATLAMAGAQTAFAQQPGEPVLTLRAAIVEALERSPQLRPSQDAVDTAEIRQHVARSQFTPKVSPSLTAGTAPGSAQQTIGLSVSQTLLTGGMVEGSTNLMRYGAGVSDQRDAGFNVGISQPLLRGFGAVTRAELESARRQSEQASRGVGDARQQLVVRVAQAYFAVVREQRLEAQTGIAFARAEKLSEMSEARASVGLATRLDVYRAGLLRSQAQAAVLRSRDALVAAREDLNVLIGRPSEESFAVDAGFAADVKALTDGGSGAARSAMPLNVEVVDAKARLSDAKQRASIAKWNQLPNVLLDVNYTKRGWGSIPDPATYRLLNGWSVGLRTAYSFDQSADGATAALAAIAVRAAERDLTDAEQRAAVDVHRAERAVTRTRDTIAIQQTAVSLAEQQRELASLRYERGLADNLEVIDAEANVFQAQSALIAAEIDHALAQLTLQRVSGTLDPDRLLR